MYILWGENGEASSPQSVPGEHGNWLPFVPARVEGFNPITHRLEKRLDGDVVREYVVKVADLPYWYSRKKAYPTLEDQLDAIWKGGAAMDEMKAKVVAVKQKYPK
jgi:hypothetical protein